MAMCEDYPCCGHTPQDPCGLEGPTSDDYLNTWERRRHSDYEYDPFDDYEGGY